MLSLEHLDVRFGDCDHLGQNFLYMQILHFIPAVVVAMMMVMMVVVVMMVMVVVVV
jgi:hypothetical protein